MKTPALLVFMVAFFSFSLTVFACPVMAAPSPGPDAETVRIARPSFKVELSPLAHFEHWKLRYAEPVFCPIAICHGSCGGQDSACVLPRGIILNKSGGCGGGCAAPESKAVGAADERGCCR